MTALPRHALIRLVREALAPEVERLALEIARHLERAQAPARSRVRPTGILPDETTQEKARQALARLGLKVAVRNGG